MDMEFLDADVLARRAFDPSRNLVVYGFGDYAQQIRMTLDACGMPVRCFCGDDGMPRPARLHGLNVIGRRELAAMHRPLVVLGDSRFQNLHDCLAGMGLAEVFGLCECLKYPYAEHLAERKVLSRFFDEYQSKRTKRILVEIYGNIGDIVVKAGILRRIQEAYGSDNVFILCDRLWGNGGEEFLRLISDNVIAVDRERFAADSDYRGERLRRLNALFFEITVCLCNVTFLSRRRCLNRLNFNVGKTYRRTELHFRRYIPDLDAALAEEFLPPVASLTPVGAVDAALAGRPFPHALPARFVSVCMGASSPLRVYPAGKFASVADHIARRGYHMVVLGHGEREENYFTELAGLVDDPCRLISYISRLSIPDSLRAIQASAFFVGVESGLWNASYVLGKPSVVLYGGGDYTGFRHRDSTIEYVSVDARDCFECRWDCDRVAQNGSAFCVDSIPPRQINAAIDRAIAMVERSLSRVRPVS